MIFPTVVTESGGDAKQSAEKQRTGFSETAAFFLCAFSDTV